VADWNHHKFIRHGGNIPGYNSDMGIVPDLNVGYVLLTNVADSLLGDEIAKIVLDNLAGNPAKTVEPPAIKPLPAEAKSEAGLYRAEGSTSQFQVTFQDGKLFLAGAGQPTVELLYEGARKYRMGPPAPTEFAATFRPWAKDPRITELFLEQGAETFTVRRSPPFVSPISPEELMVKVVEAAGLKVLAGHRSLTVRANVEFENEGLAGTEVTVWQAPNSFADKIELSALGREVAVIHDYYDGRAGGSFYSWAGNRPKTGRALADAARQYTFTRDLEWRTKYKSVEIVGIEKVGREDAYVVTLTGPDDQVATRYYSTKTFLLLRSGANPSNYALYEDYRPVQGLMVPFREINFSSSVGRVVKRVTSAAFDLPVDERLFRG
jgi:hypothetical protein